MIFIALFGNLLLLSVYLGDGVGPAIIAATTISGTMVMGLAPIFLLSFLLSAGPVSFHLAFWPGLAFVAIKTVEAEAGMPIFPDCINIGGGIYADDLGINVYGLLICTTGYLLGAVLFGRRVSVSAEGRNLSSYTTQIATVNEASAPVWCATPSVTGTSDKSVATPSAAWAVTMAARSSTSRRARVTNLAARTRSHSHSVSTRRPMPSARWVNCTRAVFSKKFIHQGSSRITPSGIQRPSILGKVL